MQHKVSAIIVTHNSERVLPGCLAGLSTQDDVDLEIIVVDSGSEQTEYLDTLSDSYEFSLYVKPNLGFSKANNEGYLQCRPDSETIVFLNPDTFLTKGYLKRAVSLLQTNPRAAVVSGTLLGFDPEQNKTNGRVDSTGIFRKWYGRWYDRDQGQENAQVKRPFSREIPAICGALMVCRKTAVKPFSPDVFDPSFFLYKEDIELSLRLRGAGWSLIYDPELIAYHCRGWNSKRNQISYAVRLMASANEILLYKKHPSPYILWALLKYMLVRWCRL